MIIRYFKLTSLQENENGFNGLTAEGRRFECLTSDSIALFRVSDRNILTVSIDKEITNWKDYKELAKDKGLALDDSEVTIQLQPKPKAKAKVQEVEKPPVEEKPKQTKPAQAKTSTKKTASKSNKK